jgi:hypothetical protein
MSTDIEELFHELEQRYASLRKESDIVIADRDSFKGIDQIFSLSYYSQTIPMIITSSCCP